MSSRIGATVQHNNMQSCNIAIKHTTVEHRQEASGTGSALPAVYLIMLETACAKA